jgi:hypothetical protein
MKRVWLQTHHITYLLGQDECQYSVVSIHTTCRGQHTLHLLADHNCEPSPQSRTCGTHVNSELKNREVSVWNETLYWNMYVYIHTHTHCNFSKVKRFWNVQSNQTFSQRGGGVIFMPGKKVPERHSGLCPSENELSEQRSGTKIPMHAHIIKY